MENAAPTPEPEAPSLDERLQRVTPGSKPAPAFLLVIDGPAAGRLHLLGDGDRIIGRGDEADIQVDDPLVSHQHARVSRRREGFFIVDLGSRNGTALNGAPIAEARLRNRDRVRVANTTAIFLEEDRGEATQTIAWHEDGAAAVPDVDAHRPPFDSFYDRGRALPAPRREEPLLDMVRRAIALGRFFWRNRWWLVPLPLLGLGLGIASIVRFPAPETAMAAVKLTHSQRENPVDPLANPWARSPKVFFEDPERNFGKRELVERTFGSLGVDPRPKAIQEALAGLGIETEVDGYYRAYFSQPLFESLPVPTVQFLEQYLDAYLVSEVDKEIRVLKSEASFLEKELEDVEKELHEVEEELLKFRRAHIDSLPEQAHAAIGGQQALALRKSELELEVERAAMDVANTRERLKTPDTALVRRFEDTRPLQSELETRERELGALTARGLKDDHPEVRLKKSQLEELRIQLSAKTGAGVNEFEERADPARVALRERLAGSEGNLRVAQKALERVDKQLAAASGKVANVPKVEANVQRLSRRLDSLQKLRAQLFEQHRKALVQIDLETANVRARYEVVEPADLVDPITKKFLITRLGGGIALGLFVALLITAAVEMRRLLQQHPELLRALPRK